MTRLKLSRFLCLVPSRLFWERLCAVSLVIVATACSGNPADGGGTGDPPSVPLADPCGGGRRMSDVVGPATWLKASDSMSKTCAYPLDTSVSLAGLRIVAIDSFDETGNGSTGNYYAQDACATPAPYQGMTIYAPSFSPPDLRLFPGDVVDLFGARRVVGLFRHGRERITGLWRAVRSGAEDQRPCRLHFMSRLLGVMLTNCGASTPDGGRCTDATTRG